MIEINNLTSYPIDEEFLNKFCRKILKSEKKKEVQLSIAFISQKEIKKLNKKYLGKDIVTDVLAFPKTEDLPRTIKVKKFQKMDILGEVIICPHKVNKNAKQFNVTFENELSRVLIHGILHLLGFNHGKSAREAKKMNEKENYYLSYFNGKK